MDITKRNKHDCDKPNKLEWMQEFALVTDIAALKKNSDRVTQSIFQSE